MTPTCKNLRKLSSYTVFQKHGVLISKHVVSENVFFEVHTFLKSRLKKDELKPSTFDATTCSSWYKAHQGPQGHLPSPTPRPQLRDARYTSPPQHHYPQRGTPGTPACPSTTTPHPRTSGKPAFTSTTNPHPGTPVPEISGVPGLGRGNVVGEGNSLGSLRSQKCLGERGGMVTDI